jgi:hypothetical protein
MEKITLATRPKFGPRLKISMTHLATHALQWPATWPRSVTTYPVLRPSGTVLPWRGAARTGARTHGG